MVTVKAVRAVVVVVVAVVCLLVSTAHAADPPAAENAAPVPAGDSPTPPDSAKENAHPPAAAQDQPGSGTEGAEGAGAGSEVVPEVVKEEDPPQPPSTEDAGAVLPPVTGSGDTPPGSGSPGDAPGSAGSPDDTPKTATPDDTPKTAAAADDTPPPSDPTPPSPDNDDVPEAQEPPLTPPPRIQTPNHQAAADRDYYGQYDDDEFGNVNVPAFQPSHLLSFVIPPGQSEAFFYDMSDADTGSVARGNFFVTAGGDLSIKALVTAPDGKDVWSKTGDFGSISFTVWDNGTYAITLTNPDFQESRRVTFAWLVGPDTDRPIEPGTNAPLSPMYKSVNRIHTRLDKVISLMAYIDMHLTRNEETSKLTKSRVALLTLAETSALVAVTLLQIWYLRRLLNNSALGCLPGAVRPLR